METNFWRASDLLVAQSSAERGEVAEGFPLARADGAQESIEMKRPCLGEGEQGARTKKARVAGAEPDNGAGGASFPGLPQVLFKRIVDDVRANGIRDDVAALRSTCKAFRRAIAPAGKGGKDELTPEGATVSVSRLQWAIRQCGWAVEEYDQWGDGDIRQTKCVICSRAAAKGHLEVLQWARQNGASWCVETCAMAAKGGHLDVLKWARANGAPWDWRTCALAAGRGHLDVLKWASENGARMNSATCSSAARGGHFEVLKWAAQNGAEMNENTCQYAAGGGHLEILKWARKNGAGWNPKTLIDAVNGGHFEVVKWVYRSEECPSLHDWDADYICNCGALQ